MCLQCVPVKSLSCSARQNAVDSGCGICSKAVWQHYWACEHKQVPVCCRVKAGEVRRLGAEDAELDGLRQELQHALSLPEQLFGDSHLRLRHEASGVTVEFSALDALRCALRRPPGLRLRGCCCPPTEILQQP